MANKVNFVICMQISLLWVALSASIASSQPDLVVTDIDAPTQVNLWSPFMVWCRVVNYGNSPFLGCHSNRLFLSKSGDFNAPDSVLLASHEFCDTLRPPPAPDYRYGSGVSVTLSNILPGNYHLTVVVNYEGMGEEVDFQNNWLSKPIWVGPIAFNQTDFVVTDLHAPTQVSVGEVFTVFWTVANYGHTTFEYDTELYLSEDDQLDMSDAQLCLANPLMGFPFVCGYDECCILLPGLSFPACSHTTMLNVPSGDYYLILVGYVPPLDYLPSNVLVQSITVIGGLESPTASFTYSPQNPAVGEEVTFDGSNSKDPDGTIVNYNWDFGDGNSGGGQVVTHIYAEPGEYAVCLNVTDNDGLEGYASESIIVESLPPEAAFTYSIEKPMVGGIIEFDASDSEGDIVEYRWDWADGTSETHSQPIAEHKFEMPGIYKVKLTVTDNEGYTSTDEKDVNLTLENGDLLLCRSEDSFVPFGFWTHVGIYDKRMNVVIEARALPEWRVGFFPLSDWFYPNQTCVEVLRVETDQPTRDAAVDFAWTQIGCPFDLFNLLHCEKLSDNFDGLGWYCSELVWAAYLNVSSGRVDILDQPVYTSTTPMEIDLDDDTVVIGEHKEFIPQKPYWRILWGETECPVDLVITDPNGLILTKEKSEIPQAIYNEIDINSNGELHDLFAIQKPKVGTYLIHVIPESNALPTDTYSLRVAINDKISVLAENVQIMDMPIHQYEFVVVPPPSPSELLSEALDTTLGFVTGGSANWFYQDAIFYSDGDAAKSGAISNNEESWIQTTMDGPGTFSFYWKVSSEARYDFLEFYIDDSLQDRISGSADWHEKTYTIPSGLHELRWRYVKDTFLASGSDCGWIDCVRLIQTF